VSPLRQKVGRKTDIVEVGRLFEIGLAVEGNYRELRAGEVERRARPSRL
jgi:hypothetical protein